MSQQGWERPQDRLLRIQRESGAPDPVIQAAYQAETTQGGETHAVKQDANGNWIAWVCAAGVAFHAMGGTACVARLIQARTGISMGYLGGKTRRNRGKRSSKTRRA